MKSLQRSWLIVFFLAASACGSPPSASDLDYQVGAGGTACGSADPACLLGNVGHEALTMMAIRQTNKFMVENGLGLLWDDSGDERTSGADSPNRIIRGNYATDKPQVVREFNIRRFQSEFFGVSPNEDWHGGGNRQVFHALRNYVYDAPTLKLPTDPLAFSIDSAKEACIAMQDVLLKTSKVAVANWRKLEFDWDYRHLVGSVTHTIQDSFSQAHTERDRANDIVSLCKFGKHAIPGVCYHSVSDAVVGHDRIFERREGSIVYVLKPNAVLAMQTTMLYLLHMARAMTRGKDVDAEIKDFFAGSPALRAEPGMNKLPVSGKFLCNKTRGHAQ